jgi:hypothetical protein
MAPQQHYDEIHDEFDDFDEEFNEDFEEEFEDEWKSVDGASMEPPWNGTGGPSIAEIESIDEDGFE